MIFVSNISVQWKKVGNFLASFVVKSSFVISFGGSIGGATGENALPFKNSKKI